MKLRNLPAPRPRGLNTNGKMLVVGAATITAQVGVLCTVAYLKDGSLHQLPFAVGFPIPSLILLPGWDYPVLTVVGVIGMLAQFPIYGYLVGQGWIRGHFWRTALRLSIFHLATAAASAYWLLSARR